MFYLDEGALGLPRIGRCAMRFVPFVCFASLAGYIANAAYEAAIVAGNAAAHADMAMAVSAAGLGIVFLAIPVLISSEEMRLTLV